MLGSSCSPCCTPPCPCAPLNEAETIEVDITAENYFRAQVWERNFSLNCGGTSYAPGSQFATAAFFPGDDINGTWQLDLVESTATSKLWRTTFGDDVAVRRNVLEIRAYGENPLCRQLFISLQLVTRRRFVCDSASVTESDLECPGLWHPYSGAGVPGLFNGCQFVGSLIEAAIACEDHDRDDEPLVAPGEFPISATASTWTYEPPATDAPPFTFATLISDSETGDRGVTIDAVRAYL